MKLIPVTNIAADQAALEAEFKAARQVGAIRLGEKHFFFKAKMKQHYIPYEDIKKCYRRVVVIPTRMCCGKGELLVENLVIGGDEGELAVIQLPGSNAAKVLFEDVKKLLPNADFTSPKRDEDGNIISDDANAVPEGAGA